MLNSTSVHFQIAPPYVSKPRLTVVNGLSMGSCGGVMCFSLAHKQHALQTALCRSSDNRRKEWLAFVSFRLNNYHAVAHESYLDGVEALDRTRHEAHPHALAVYLHDADLFAQWYESQSHTRAECDGNLSTRRRSRKRKGNARPIRTAWYCWRVYWWYRSSPQTPRILPLL